MKENCKENGFISSTIFDLLFHSPMASEKIRESKQELTIFSSMSYVNPNQNQHIHSCLFQ